MKKIKLTEKKLRQIIREEKAKLHEEYEEYDERPPGPRLHAPTPHEGPDGLLFLYFTDEPNASEIIGSGRIRASKNAGGVIATVVGGAWAPHVQRGSMPKSSERALLFSTPLRPDHVEDEETLWHLPHIPVDVREVFDLADAGVDDPEELSQLQELLDGSIGFDGETGLLRVPHHPAFSDQGKWTRMPEDFEPWTPGRDNRLYERAAKVWAETGKVAGVIGGSGRVAEVRRMWKPGMSEAQLRRAIRGLFEGGLSGPLRARRRPLRRR